ncbi:hypothetical protein LUZ60_016954 [Juncus effusus]|nr:hypothetical protein LUZ60_016954 [Juncus effusus]
MTVSTVRVSNVSLQASQQDLKEFFSFSGDILYVEMQKENDLSQIAYITFKDTQGAETAMLLTGATIVDMSVIVMPSPDYQLPAGALLPPSPRSTNPVAPSGVESALQKAEDTISAMLAKGFVLGKDALEKAKALDEKHQISSSATARVTNFDKKIGLSEKIAVGTVVMNEKVKEIDVKYQVSEKTKSTLMAAEQTLSNAGSAIANNRYILTSAAWVTGAFNKAKEKLTAEPAQAVSEPVSSVYQPVSAGSEPVSESREVTAPVLASEEPAQPAQEPVVEPAKKPEPAQGLIL